VQVPSLVLNSRSFFRSLSSSFRLQSLIRSFLKQWERAINKAVTFAEILKRKMPLHQVNCLTSSEVVGIFEPLEESLDVVESKRCVSCMTITLSTTEQGVDRNDIGYQVCN